MVGAGAGVEFGHDVVGRGQHDGVAAGEMVGDPRGEGIVVGGAEVPGVDAAVVQVPAQRGGVTVAQLQTRCRFSTRSEPHDVGQGE